VQYLAIKEKESGYVTIREAETMEDAKQALILLINSSKLEPGDQFRIVLGELTA
jgi:hypothetical protein